MTSWKWLAALMAVFVAVGLRGVRRDRHAHLLAVLAIVVVVSYEAVRGHVL